MTASKMVPLLVFPSRPIHPKMSKPLVHSILVGGFDIVGGAVALHQFPKPLGYDTGTSFRSDN